VQRQGRGYEQAENDEKMKIRTMVFPGLDHGRDQSLRVSSHSVLDVGQEQDDQKQSSRQMHRVENRVDSGETR